MTFRILLTIAWRNIWRHPARSSVLLGAIAIGLWAGVFTVATMNGMLKQRFDYLIENEVSHIQIHNPEFLTERHPSDVIKNSEDLREWLNLHHQIQSYSSRVLVDGILQSTVKASGVRIRGIDREEEVKTTIFYQNMISGNYFETEIRNPILIGEKLASENRIELGHRIVLTFEDALGDLVSSSFNVIGIFRSASTDFDGSNVFVDRKDLSNLLSIGDGLHEIAIRLYELEQFHHVASDLKDSFPAHKVRTWRQVSPELSTLIDLGGVMLYIVTFIIMLALAFGILNTMLMALFERTSELGVLLSIGMDRLRIFLMMMIESCILTLVGSFVGMLAAFATITYLRPRGVNFEMFADGIAQLGWDHRVYPFLSFSEYVTILLIVILVSFFASLYPAYRAMRL